MLVFLSIAALLIAFGFTFSLDQTERNFWLSEGGVVETLSALGYFLCAMLMVVLGGWAYVKKYHYCLLLVLLFGMRELDFDKRFTTMGIFKSKFYASSEVPIIEKVLGLIVIAVILYIIFRFVRNHLKILISSLLKLSPLHVAIFFALSFAFISKTLDGIARKLSGFGFQIESSTSIHFEALEEILELGIPTLLIIAVISFYHKSKHEELR